jgi:hypothetical protein
MKNEKFLGIDGIVNFSRCGRLLVMTFYAWLKVLLELDGDAISRFNQSYPQKFILGHHQLLESNYLAQCFMEDSS